MVENNKNKIIVSREKISSEEVKLQQNFSKIISHHKKITKRPIYKQKKFFLAILLIMIVSLLLYLADKEEVQMDPVNVESTF